MILIPQVFCQICVEVVLAQQQNSAHHQNSVGRHREDEYLGVNTQLEKVIYQTPYLHKHATQTQ